jgi:hypothetical protein
MLQCDISNQCTHQMSFTDTSISNKYDPIAFLLKILHPWIKKFINDKIMIFYPKLEIDKGRIVKSHGNFRRIEQLHLSVQISAGTRLRYEIALFILGMDEASSFAQRAVVDTLRADPGLGVLRPLMGNIPKTKAFRTLHLFTSHHRPAPAARPGSRAGHSGCRRPARPADEPLGPATPSDARRPPGSPRRPGGPAHRTAPSRGYGPGQSPRPSHPVPSGRGSTAPRCVRSSALHVG